MDWISSAMLTTFNKINTDSIIALESGKMVARESQRVTPRLEGIEDKITALKFKRCISDKHTAKVAFHF